MTGLDLSNVTDVTVSASGAVAIEDGAAGLSEQIRNAQTTQPPATGKIGATMSEVAAAGVLWRNWYSVC